MYLYIYENYLNQPRYEVTITKIEARLIDLGIQGKTERFGPLRSLQNIIQDGIKSGIKTIVAVGGDKLYMQLVAALAGNKKIILGFIPVEENSRIAMLLGIPLREKSCDILSSRIVKKIDLGKIQNRYFLSSLETNDNDVVIECDHRYYVSLRTADEKVSICNFGNIFSLKQLNAKEVQNPSDGYLEVIVEPPTSYSIFRLIQNGMKRQKSIFRAKKFFITSKAKSSTWKIDGANVIKTPFEVEIAPSKLSMIVGKERLFNN